MSPLFTDLQTVSHSPQLCSSPPSEQSIELSHLQVWGMHCPSPQWNSDDLHVGGEPHNSGVSSRPSLQSTRPSHSWFVDRQVSDGPQEKAVQFWQEVSSLPSPQFSMPSQRKRREMHRLLWQANSWFPHKLCVWPVKSYRKHSSACRPSTPSNAAATY